MGASGGIDLGGTKIEAVLFDEALERQAVRRVNTPRDDYGAVLDAITDLARWIRAEAGIEVPIGLGCPGFFDRETGLAKTANLPVTGKPFRSDLSARITGLTVENDLSCFVLSEATGGAGAEFRHVFGLNLGTGVGGALAVDGALFTGGHGRACEIGHIPVSAALAEAHGVPRLVCGCGLTGCVETVVSGPGLAALARHLRGRDMTAPQIVAAEAAGDADAAAIMDAWLDLAAQLCLTVQLAFDPECIVLGGGLSRIENLPRRLAERYAPRAMPGVRPPEIRAAIFGDASGARGAALFALQEARAR